MMTRLRSLDIFRGITVALMIIVNSPGNSSSYSWLTHSHWNGCSLADLVFPFFIYIVGISVVYAYSTTKTAGLGIRRVWPDMLKRTLFLLLLGIVLNAFPNHFDLANLRIYGVLQRIAICYFVAAYLYLSCSATAQFIILLTCLIGYYLLMIVVPVPDLTGQQLSLDNNWVAYIDRLLFSPAHLYGKTYDPEGLLSTLPAIATALLGTLSGIGLQTSYSPKQKISALTLASGIALLIGWIWGLFFPINKTLWSSSYVLWSGGLAGIMLAICYWLIEIKSWVTWSKPFYIFGINAILAYLLHVAFLKIQAIIPMTLADGSLSNLRVYITDCCFNWASAQNASLLYASSYTLLWLFILSSKQLTVTAFPYRSIKREIR